MASSFDARSAARSSSSIEHGRFLPGVVLDGRYRIVGLVGTGAMGEVYRADDLKLGQAVALKFLPRELEGEPGVPQRYLDEVRLARQVSHPNVCRVHDIGEFEGQTYLSMEYVDGEDLASLLRRVGHLPQARATEIAREICAGLAAAHQRGVLHRDLKPANVMIDGRGRARIADFGLASAAVEMAQDERIVGTPAFLAPELLTGRGASVRSDLYALGLVLYELFTGRPPFESDTVGELLRRHREEEPPPPARFVPGIAPGVEQAILRCLEKDPAQRPTSALAVAALLPGSDPLAAALAAGETPSPEMVAQAGEVGALARPLAGLLVALVLAGVWLVAVLNRGLLASELVDLPLAPEVLRHRALEILDDIGWPGAVRQIGRGLASTGDGARWYRAGRHDAARMAQLRSNHPALLLYWQRTFPEALTPWGDYGRVSLRDPPLTVPGMSMVLLGVDGRLIRFQGVPSGLSPAASAQEPDWAPLFAAAGLDPERFESMDLGFDPGFACDVRRGWRGGDPWLPGYALEVLAAGWGGVPTFFANFSRPAPDGAQGEQGTDDGAGDAETPAPAEPAQAEARATPDRGVLAGSVREVTKVLVLIASIVLARRNLLSGLGDRRGANRVALWFFAAFLLRWLLEADHRADVAFEWALLSEWLEKSVFNMAWLWLLYMAIEPMARRAWPRALVAWSRLLAGRWRDPLVGRDVLVGVLAGVVMTALVRVATAAALGAGLSPPVDGFLHDTFLGLRYWLGRLVYTHADYAFGALSAFLVLAVARRFLRLPWLCYAAVLALGTMAWPSGITIGSDPWDYGLSFALIGVMLVVAVRFGLLALVVALTVNPVLEEFPLTTNLAAWNGGATGFVVLVVGALAAFGYAASTRGVAGARA